MDGIGNNIVLFRVGSFGKGPTPVSYGAVLRLCVDGAWKLACGVEPTVNSARVPWTEYDRLNGDTGPITGQIEFWWTKMPGVGVEPDHVLANVTLVEVEASEFGPVSADGPRQAVEYRLYFADSRQWWLPPRGGHLSLQGVLNAPGDQYMASNSLLINYLLKKLGVSEAKIIMDQEAVDELPVMRNLEWRAAHPQVELKKLLDELGLVLAPQADGVSFRVDVAGVGPAPKIPDGRDLGTVPLPGIDRRGKCVVFSSAPIAKIITETMTGPDAQTFQFVVQDPITGKRPDEGQHTTDQWTLLEDLMRGWVWKKTDPPISVYQDRFSRFGESRQPRLLDQSFRFLRFNPFLRTDILRQVFEGHELTGSNIVVRAKIAQPNDIGLWKNSEDFIDIPVVCLMKVATECHDNNGNYVDGYVVGVGSRLLQVQDDEGDGVLDPITFAVELGEGDIEIRVSHEGLVMTTGSNIPLQ